MAAPQQHPARGRSSSGSSVPPAANPKPSRTSPSAPGGHGPASAGGPQRFLPPSQGPGPFDDPEQGVEFLCERFTSLLQNFHESDRKRLEVEKRLGMVEKEKSALEEDNVRRVTQLETKVSVLEAERRELEGEVLAEKERRGGVEKLLVGVEAEKGRREREAVEVGE